MSGTRLTGLGMTLVLVILAGVFFIARAVVQNVSSTDKVVALDKEKVEVTIEQVPVTEQQAEELSIQQIVESKGLNYPLTRIFLRAFKREAELEVWGGNDPTSPLKLIKIYPIAKISGTLGPKRREGDLQVPEGFYFIDRFNPESNFHLSLGINYPNESDQILSDKEHPGKDIFIHGNEVSVGCLAMTDKLIEEIYAFAEAARKNGQKQIPVHIFPTRMDEEGLAYLEQEYGDNEELLEFWMQLQPGYTKFEKTGTVYTPQVDEDGTYQF